VKLDPLVKSVLMVPLDHKVFKVSKDYKVSKVFKVSKDFKVR